MRLAFLLLAAPSSVANPTAFSIWNAESAAFFQAASASPVWLASSNFVKARIGDRSTSLPSSSLHPVAAATMSPSITNEPRRQAKDSRQLAIDHTSLVEPAFGVPSSEVCLEMRIWSISSTSSSITCRA